MRSGAAKYWLAVLMGWGCMACGSSNNDKTATYSYTSCSDSTPQCPGQGAFQCAMDTITAKHARCTTDADCVAADVPDASTCAVFCQRALVNSSEKDAYQQEAKTEIYRYCQVDRCVAEIYCPRPNNAIPQCFDGGCRWTEGELLDAGTP